MPESQPFTEIARDKSTIPTRKGHDNVVLNRKGREDKLKISKESLKPETVQINKKLEYSIQ